MYNDLDYLFMQQALLQALIARKKNELPVGAVVVYNNNIIGTGYNTSIHEENQLSHAEMNAIKTIKKGFGYTMYVTLEPCIMCIGALAHLGFSRVVFGATCDKFGATEAFNTISWPCSSVYKTRFPLCIKGPCSHESKVLLQDFFLSRR